MKFGLRAWSHHCDTVWPSVPHSPVAHIPLLGFAALFDNLGALGAYSSHPLGAPHAPSRLYAVSQLAGGLAMRTHSSLPTGLGAPLRTSPQASPEGHCRHGGGTPSAGGLFAPSGCSSPRRFPRLLPLAGRLSTGSRRALTSQTCFSMPPTRSSATTSAYSGAAASHPSGSGLATEAELQCHFSDTLGPAQVPCKTTLSLQKRPTSPPFLSPSPTPAGPLPPLPGHPSPRMSP